MKTKPMQTLINNERDWTWLLRGLDQAGREDFEHAGGPVLFPCIMESRQVSQIKYVHRDVTAAVLPALAKNVPQFYRVLKDVL